MFDLATRQQPDLTSTAALVSVPFDLRLAPPMAAMAYPYTTLVTDTALPESGVEMLATYALALEGGLATAVTLSLFTDARAGADDTLPLRQVDRRGWVGNEFMGTPDTALAPVATAERWGSLLWLLYQSKATADILERARFAAQESLAWMVRDGIASRIDVAANWVASRNGGPDRLAIRPTIWQPDQVAPVYDVLWGTSFARWMSA